MLTKIHARIILTCCLLTACNPSSNAGRPTPSNPVNQPGRAGTAGLASDDSLRISAAVFFGDSLSDPGNMHRLYGEPTSPPYHSGRYSNGPVWTEYLSSLLGLPQAAVQNYAHGGATTGYSNTSVPGAPGLLREVEFYANHVVSNGPPDPDSLFVLWIGPNDFATATSLSASVSTAMLNIDQAITSLAGMGAKHFLVLNAPDLARTPHVRDQGDPALSERAHIATIAFNANLAWSLAELEPRLGIDIVHQDFHSLFEEVVARPSSYGFTDVTSRCLQSITSPPCANPNEHVFWDGLHPTTAAHQLIAKQAVTALLSGGTPLPRPGNAMPNASVVLASPTHGWFSPSDTITVTGNVYAPTALTATLDVNGVQAQVASNGSFSVNVDLEPGRTQQAVVATLMSGTEVLDRDRVVVFRGPSTAGGETVATAVAASLTRHGIADIEDFLIHELVTNNTLNIAQRLFAANPLSSNYQGTARYQLDATGAGYGWSTIQLEPQSDRIHVRLNLHDVFIDWSAHAWLHKLPDPGFDCSGRVTAGMVSVFADLLIQPGNGPGAVRVTQIGPLGFEMPGFHEEHQCDIPSNLVIAVARMFTDFHVNIEQQIRDEIRNRLDGANHVLPRLVERALSDISVSRAVGGALGVPVGGDIESIATSTERVTVAGHLAIGASSPTNQRTVAVPHGPIPHSSIVPITGQAYDFAVSVALTTLNQLLLAKADTLVQPFTIDQLDLGSGPVALTAGTLAVLIPALQAIAPSTPLQLRIRPTLAPRLLGQPTGPVVNTIGELSVPQLLVELVPPGMNSNASLVTMSLDVAGGLEIGFDPQSAELTARVANGTAAVTLIDNQLGAQEQSLVQLIEALVPRFVSSIGTAHIALPQIPEANVAVEQVVAENGFASIYFRATTPYGQPDLQIEGIQTPPAIDRNFGFFAPVSVTNRGTASSFGSGFEVRAFLSLDSNMDPTDIQVGSLWMPVGALPVGQTATGLMWIEPMPWAANANQTLHFYADCPNVPGGSGFVWERDERNNVGSVGILTTAPDAYVAWVQAPTNVVGGVGPRSYRVRVGRNDVGVNAMDVQLTVTIGTPTITWHRMNVSVPRGQEIEVDVPVLTPGVNGVGGQISTFPVLAGGLACDAFGLPLITGDSNPSNDFASTAVDVAAPYFDLEVTIVGQGPGSAGRCNQTGWQIQVRNLGNIDSPPASVNTCIGPYSNPWGSGPNLPVWGFGVQSLSPGQATILGVSNYFIDCFAFTGQQYVGAWTSWNGPVDGNDFASAGIWIY